ncbi:Rz1-like lysis system protein LysC [Rheinheimera mesophila]|uniref:Rz1-like lysis system protein LysC n=1 Tax=Rheinheimera mesophila TaxID=1547515 RepID=UPI003F4FDC11
MEVRTITVTKTVTVLPPANFLQSGCALRPFNGTTNHDHLQYTLQLITDIKLCDTDVQRYRKWREAQVCNQDSKLCQTKQQP